MTDICFDCLAGNHEWHAPHLGGICIGCACPHQVSNPTQGKDTPVSHPIPPQHVLPKNPALALFVSFLFPGVGSIMVGRVGMGVLIILAYSLSWLLCVFLVGFLLVPIVWIWGMADAYLGAKNWNLQHGIVS